MGEVRSAATTAYRVAPAARIHGNRTAKYQAEGLCSVCGLAVPVWVTEKRERVAEHYSDDPAHTYDNNPRYFCRGSSRPPASYLDGEPLARIRVSPETMALLMDGAANELAGRVTILAISFADRVSAEAAHRFSRSLSELVATKNGVVATRIRVYDAGRLAVE